MRCHVEINIHKLEVKQACVFSLLRTRFAASTGIVGSRRITTYKERKTTTE